MNTSVCPAVSAADDREAAGEADAEDLLLPETPRAGQGGAGVPQVAAAGLRQPPVDRRVPAPRVLRAARVQPGGPHRPHQHALRGHPQVHRAALRAHHRSCAARASQQVPGPQVHHLGLLQRHAAARLQRPQQLPLQPEEHVHLPERGHLPGGLHAPHLQLSFVHRGAASHW